MVVATQKTRYIPSEKSPHLTTDIASILVNTEPVRMFSVNAQPPPVIEVEPPIAPQVIKRNSVVPPPTTSKTTWPSMSISSPPPTKTSHIGSKLDDSLISHSSTEKCKPVVAAENQSSKKSSPENDQKTENQEHMKKDPILNQKEVEKEKPLHVNQGKVSTSKNSPIRMDQKHPTRPAERQPSIPSYVPKPPWYRYKQSNISIIIS